MMVLLLMCAVLAAQASPANEPTPTAQQVRFFETSVRPLLHDQCLQCHGAKKQWGGLRLDSREALLEGGDSGPAIVAGNPDESLLIRAVRHVDDDLQMPQDGRLTPQQIAILVDWVAMGAPFPATTVVAEPIRDPDHWAFQPPAEPSVPVIVGSDWPQSAVDHFILARLAATGLSPSPPANKRTLIRRVTFDLIGLPPTPAEIDAFLADASPVAFARVVDRLLASPQYGERWARHWLDVARYADSNGFDENVAHGNAWRYRDYVVAAFNRDKPFERFVIEQLAGDLLPFNSQAEQHEQLIATGFLSIGPKVLAETDEAKMRMDIIDEQLDTTGRAFLGLTLGCARCHDHKFDPIDAADYYGLAGIFKSTQSMRKYIKVAEWHENLLPSDAATAIQADFDAQVAARTEAIAQFAAAANQRVRERQAADHAALPPETPQSLESEYPDEIKAELKKLNDELEALRKAGPNLPSAMGVGEDAVTDMAIHVRGNPLRLGDIVPRNAPRVLRGRRAPEFTDRQSGRLELAQWLVDPQHPLTARVFVNRVWRWHFGQGLVRTTDNFGLQGEDPSHPELLDWLARQFIAGGWSVKTLHRLILLSSTYQQASESGAEPLSQDPENRFFGRYEMRRLEAEAVRDSLLAASGQLDATMGGSLLNVRNRAHFFDHTSKDLTTYDSHRRSLYLPIVRNNVFDFFQVLDFADPAVSNGNRATTVVASQALLMLNSNFVMQAAADFADRLFAESPDDEQRLSRLYAIAFGRAPTPEERQADRNFLARVALAQSTAADADQLNRQAWAALCHVVLAANEFMYIQ